MTPNENETRTKNITQSLSKKTPTVNHVSKSNKGDSCSIANTPGLTIHVMCE